VSYILTVDSGSDRLAEWDDWVDRHPGGSVFHTWRWLKGFGSDPELFTVRDERERTVGGMCLVKTRKYGVTGYHVPPYTPYFGPVVHDFAEKKRASALAHQEKVVSMLLDAVTSVSHCDFIFPCNGFSILPFHWHHYSVEVRITFEIRASGEDPGNTWELSLEKSPRSHLRKLRSEVDRGDLKVFRSNRPDASLYPMIAAVGKRKRFNPRIRRLETLLSGLEDHELSTYAVADTSGELLAGDICVVDSGRYYMLTSFRHPEWRQRCPHAHLLSRALSIQTCLNNNKIFDFEGSMIRGVADFNRSLGGEPAPVFRAQRSKSIRFNLARCIRRLTHEFGTR